MAASAVCTHLEGHECSGDFVALQTCVRLSGRLLSLSPLLQFRYGGIAAGGGETAGLERTAVEARSVVVVALADDFAAADDDAAVAVVEGGFAGLLEAKGEVGVGARRHCLFGCLGLGLVT